MRRRSYERAADLALLQAFSAESIAVTGGCGYVHPGDIPIGFQRHKHFAPAEVMTVSEDRSGAAALGAGRPQEHLALSAMTPNQLHPERSARTSLQPEPAMWRDLR